MCSNATQAVLELCSGSLSELSEDSLLAMASEVRELAGRLSGRVDQVLAELASRSSRRASGQPVMGWWRDDARVTGRRAGSDVRRALALRRLPVLGQAVVDGVLTPAQGHVLAHLDGRVPHEQLLAAQERLVEAARGMDPEALGRFVRQVIAEWTERGLDHEQADARERRHLEIRHHVDGTVSGRFVLAAEDAEAVLTVLEPLARRAGLEDERTAGQRRADALVDVFAGAAAWMDLPVAGGQRPQLTYVLGPAGATGAWTGPQTEARVAAVLCDARVSRLLLGPASAVLSMHSLTGDITRAQRKAVSARDRCCVAKGCTRPPAFCDVHHLTHREHDGATEVGNLVLLCRRHHLMWHRRQLRLNDLRVPWLAQHRDAEHGPGDPWDDHNPPMVA